jgi:hypothetical protein
MNTITKTKLFGAGALAVLALGAGVGGALAPSGLAASRTTAADVSGPCDEAEHANDPRCTTGAATRKADDNGRHRRGKGKGRHGRRHD